MQLVYAVGGFTSATNYYRTAANQGHDATATFTKSVLCWVDADTGVVQFLASNGNGGGANPGWVMRVVSSVVNFRMADGTSTAVDSPGHTIVAADLGKIHLATGVHDGTNLRLYWDGIEEGSGTAITGATGIGASMYECMGVKRNFGGPFVDGSILGVSGDDATALSAANVLALWNAYKSAGAVTDAQTPTLFWDCKANARGAPTEWVESVAGTHNMDEVGTMTPTGARVAIWGR